MEKVAVTGYTGFIGRHLVEALTKRGFIVYPIGRDFRPVECDRVYHLANPSSTEVIMNNPLYVIDAIVDNTRKAMDICPDALFVNASSKGAAFIEDGPQGGYNIAKRLMEIYLSLSSNKCLNYRIPSVYGLGMHESMFIKRCVEKKAYVPHNRSQIHYIAHVTEVVDAMIDLRQIEIEEITLGEIYESFGSGRRGLHRPTPST